MTSAAAPLFLLFYLGGSRPEVPRGQAAGLEGKAALASRVDGIIKTAGGVGDHERAQLGFSVGPLMFDLTDAQTRALIADSFAVAEEKDVAVAFHIDDSMFWNAREDLWSDKNNVEWTDWQGTTEPHRIIGWAAGGKPVLAPQMCYESPAIKAAAVRRARLIGAEVAKGLRRLRASGKPYLYAGVIAGWETRLQDDSGRGGDREPMYGYCALHHLGYGPGREPADLDKALVGVVGRWIELWAKSLAQAGVPKESIYTHNGTPPKEVPPGLKVNLTRLAYKHAPPDVVAFNAYARPGFSVYGADGFPALHRMLARRPARPWGVSEGTNVDLDDSFSGGPRPSRLGMETYLARAFNHGAALVNLYGWSPAPSDAFGKATTDADAATAYRKFLSGARLREEPAAKAAAPARSGLPDKVGRIQAELPAWIQAHPERRSEAAALMPRLEAAMKAGDPAEAERAADRVLSLIER